MSGGEFLLFLRLIIKMDAFTVYIRIHMEKTVNTDNQTQNSNVVKCRFFYFRNIAFHV